MIHPRQSTSRQYVAVVGNINPLVSVDMFRDRPPRHCPCGTRLRRSKPLYELLCDACDARRLVDLDLAELHPPVEVHVRPSDHTTCPDCGGKMHKRAQRCKACRSAWVKAQKHPVWPAL
jgi:predicted nucleic acid-binding Zn ribbon protein